MNWRVAITMVAMVLAAGCARSPALIELSGPTMGTTYSVKVVNPPAGVDRQSLLAVTDQVLKEIDEQMSGYRSDSEIARFNQSDAAGWVDVSPGVAKVVSVAEAVSKQSGGALDLTVAPLVNLWGMGPQGEVKDPPGVEQIDAARALVGYRKLHVRSDGAGLRKELPRLTVDLNAVAPGYAADLLAERLSTLGIANFMVDMGGEVRARGRNADNETWRIAVERPVDAEPQPYAVLQLNDVAVTTSGEYRHYVMRDGHRYSHTIDPRTGRPVEHALASVVVVMPTALEADAWSTALNVLGEDEGYALASEQGIAAMFIVGNGEDFEPRMTPTFNQYLAVAPR